MQPSKGESKAPMCPMETAFNFCIPSLRNMSVSVGLTLLSPKTRNSRYKEFNLVDLSYLIDLQLCFPCLYKFTS